MSLVRTHAIPLIAQSLYANFLYHGFKENNNYLWLLYRGSYGKIIFSEGSLYQFQVGMQPEAQGGKDCFQAKFVKVQRVII